VGQKLANRLGLHDLLGNVEQITLEPFRLTRPDELQGQAGGYVVKGGFYLANPRIISLGHRREVPFFDLSGETRGEMVGARLALSVPVFVGGVSPNPTKRYVADLQNQPLTAALDAAHQHLVANQETARGRADAGVGDLLRQTGAVDRDRLREQLNAIKANLDRSNAQLAVADETTRRETLEAAVLLAANVRALRHSSETNRLLTEMLSDEARACLRPADLALRLQRLARIRDRIGELETAVQPTYDYYLSRVQDLARLPPDQRNAAADAVARAFRGRSLAQYGVFQQVVVQQTETLAASNNALSDKLRRLWADELYNALQQPQQKEPGR
jgi:hypothetical protein